MSFREKVIYDEAAYERGRNARIAANAIKGRWQRWVAADESRKALASEIHARGYDRPDSFFGKMSDALHEWGSLSERQEAAVRKILAEEEGRKAQRAAEDARSEWVGEVGQRQEFEVEVKLISGFEGDYGWVSIHVFKDAAGNVLVHKGSGLGLERGQKVRLKASVKAHEVREGVKQSRIARPKVLEEAA